MVLVQQLANVLVRVPDDLGANKNQNGKLPAFLGADQQSRADLLPLLHDLFIMFDRGRKLAFKNIKGACPVVIAQRWKADPPDNQEVDQGILVEILSVFFKLK